MEICGASWRLSVYGPQNLTISAPNISTTVATSTGTDNLDEITTVDFIESSSSYNTCQFDSYERGAIFDTGTPYSNNMRCVESFSCENSTETVHFKFDRFDVEENYDYLVIGNPIRFGNYHDYHFGSIEGFESFENIDNPDSQIGVILHGSQITGTWVNAQSIPTFNIYFFRKVFNAK